MNEFRPKEYLTGILIVVPLISLALISIITISFDRSEAKWPTILVFVANFLFYFALIYKLVAHHFQSSRFALQVNAYKSLYNRPGSLDIPVKTAMIERAKISETVTLPPPPDRASGIKIRDLLSRLNPPVNRIPVFDPNGAAGFIIHEITLYKFIAKKIIDGEANQLDATTLGDLLNDDVLSQFLKRFVVVSGSATLAHTKELMDSKLCNDAFVTESGAPTDVVIGWVTDTRVAEFTKN
jgi:hypothetical protein